MTNTASELPASTSLPASAFTPKPLPATQLHAKPSANFDAKLAETEALLRQAAADFQPVTQASSLGAEDVVITHLINALALDIPVFVLETGALPPETLALLERTVQTSRAPVNVYRPVQEAVVQFVAREGADAMYRSIDLRKACCGIRKMEPLGRARITTPSPASTTHTPSRIRRDPATATPRGPRNSTATTMPTGARLMAS
jgi:phosphoadenosine phosphosulfate reductase